MAVQHLDGKKVHLETLGTLGVLWLLLWFAMAEEEEAIRLCGAEVKGDRACLLSVPLVEDDKRLWGLKRDGVQSGHVFTLEGHSTMDLHLGITQLGQPGQFKSYVVVFVHNLKKKQRKKVISTVSQAVAYLTYKIKNCCLQIVNVTGDLMILM